ncbi:hypothetical protein OQA88_9637 [Cercophora sp. LCS_1]
MSAALPLSQHAEGDKIDFAPDESNSAVALPDTTLPQFKCKRPDCPSDFASQAELNLHINQKHLKPHLCPHSQCTGITRFGTAKDLKRHITTFHDRQASQTYSPAEQLVCPEFGCKRNGKPFSRRDNFMEHIREVHKHRGENDQELQTSEDTSSPSTPNHNGAPVLPGGTEGCLKSRGKRRADEPNDEENEMKDCCRDDFIQTILQERRKRRKAEEELQLQQMQGLSRLGKLLNLMTPKGG